MMLYILRIREVHWLKALFVLGNAEPSYWKAGTGMWSHFSPFHVRTHSNFNTICCHENARCIFPILPFKTHVYLSHSFICWHTSTIIQIKLSHRLFNSFSSKMFIATCAEIGDIRCNTQRWNEAPRLTIRGKLNFSDAAF